MNTELHSQQIMVEPVVEYMLDDEPLCDFAENILILLTQPTATIHIPIIEQKIWGVWK